MITLADGLLPLPRTPFTVGFRHNCHALFGLNEENHKNPFLLQPLTHLFTSLPAPAPWKKTFCAHVRCKTNNNILLFYPFVQNANDFFVHRSAFVLWIMTSAVPFYMDHKQYFSLPDEFFSTYKRRISQCSLFLYPLHVTPVPWWSAKAGMQLQRAATWNLGARWKVVQAHHNSSLQLASKLQFLGCLVLDNSKLSRTFCITFKLLSVSPDSSSVSRRAVCISDSPGSTWPFGGVQWCHP